MTQLRIGQFADKEQRGRRDSFHVPAVLALGTKRMKPGTSVVFTDTSYSEVREADSDEQRHGIVDPFLPEATMYAAFWVLLEPNLVQQLTHHFDLDIPGVPPHQPTGAYSNTQGYIEDDDGEDDYCRGCW